MHQARPKSFCGIPSAASRGFTLIEVLFSLVIITILISIGALSFRKAAESNVLAQARNAVVTYAKIARSYAVANQIETMMVVNPYNGRFEVWRKNPPHDGSAVWDPNSSGTRTGSPELTDGYCFVPLLDSGARLPTNSRGEPMALVSPIDYDNSNYRPTVADPDDRNIDNLTWAAFCFDEEGTLVIRTRRIATRSYTLRNGTPRPADPDTGPNRLADETPDLTMSMTVTASDSPITSTRGFVISDAGRFRNVLGRGVVLPADLVNTWLMATRPSQPYASFTSTVVLNRFTGQVLTGAPG